MKIKSQYLSLLICCQVFLWNCLANPVDSEPVKEQEYRGHSIVIANGQFNPRAKRVVPGSTVRWTNEDSEVRTIRSGTQDAPTREFASPNLGLGDFFEHTFYQLGTYEFFSPETGATGTIGIALHPPPCWGFGCWGN